MKLFYRYQSLDTRTIKALCEDTLFFSSPSKFNDPFDCQPIVESDNNNLSLQNALIQLIFRRVEIQAKNSLKTLSFDGQQAIIDAKKVATKSVREILGDIQYNSTNPDYSDNGINKEKAENSLLTQQLKTELENHYNQGVCCFSEEFENPLLWSHYGDQHKGICIGYNCNRNPQPVLHKVNYDGNRTVKTSEIIKALVHSDEVARKHLDKIVLLSKTKPWEYEKEYRIINEIGIQSSVLALNEIHFGTRCPEALKFVVISLLRKRANDIGFYNIRQTYNESNFFREEVDIDEMFRFYPKVAESGFEMFGEED